MFGRPTIEKLVQDELYDTQRKLLQAEAGLLHARIAQARHEADVRILTHRCQELKQALVTYQVNEKQPALSGSLAEMADEYRAPISAPINFGNRAGQ